MCRLGPSPLVLAAAALVACSSTEAPRRQSSSADSAAAEQAEANGGQSTSDAHAVDAAPARSIEPARRVLAYRDGVARPMDERDASAAGLTIVDLRDGWAPSVLRGTPELPSSYETVYVDLANERGEPAHDSDPRAADYYLEVYGITPAPSIIRSRLEREEAAPCFATLDYDTLARFDGFLAYQGKSASNLQGKARAFQVLERRVQTLMRQQGVERPEDVTGTRDQALARQYLAQAARVLPLRAAQKRLECEGLFPGRGRYVADAFDWATHIGLLNFERRHRLYGWGYLNQDTARALAWWPREAALETLRRALAERIVDAAGVIEDGSTWSGEEPPTYLGADGSRHPVRNLVEEMTEAAMGHLGLNGPDEAAAFLAEHDFATLRVALPLPELPEYYSDHMDLYAVIDRGDVWYDYPFDADGNERPQPMARRPTTTLFVRHLGKGIPLVRYGTTIGGWRSEHIRGVEYWSYKNSDVGDRVWRHVIGAPAWIPPDTTPPRDLVTKRRGSSRWHPHYAETGPGYASAYGLVMGIHEQARERPDGTVAYFDNGIRSHGSVSYQSIQKRHSHGCHRLHNHLALRLFSFVLAKREHRREGQLEIRWGRTIEHEGQRVSMSIDNRGYLFELTPPMPVTVIEGRIMGSRRAPHTEPIIKPHEAERLVRERAAAGGDAGPEAGLDGGRPAGVGGGAVPLAPSPF